ncbi:rhodanese-like domain-containing protein [Methanobacterium sp.]|uniref:rhodanese-like domain-containing protein n=1 Tax=Methanobacterium sp. TaxID=2164 RepID=UPI003C78F6EB
MSQFKTITPKAALKLIEEKGQEITILDIRPKEDFEKEHIPGAENLDYHGHQFQKKAEALDKNKDYLIYCKSGVRGGYFMDKMKESGFSGAYNILGGFVAWKISRLPLEDSTD